MSTTHGFGGFLYMHAHTLLWGAKPCKCTICTGKKTSRSTWHCI